jgi:NDP-sugar pyrophosphorylase family protein
MQAVILAGGLGTRLWPITRDIPKPMVPVAGVPYLEHQLRDLARRGIGDIVLLTGYLGGQIEEYFGDGARLGLRVRYSREPKPLGTGGALKFASPLLDETFLVIYGDSYLPIDYAAMLAALDSSAATGIVATYLDRKGETGVHPNIAATGGFVTAYDKAGSSGLDLDRVEAGVSAFRKSVLALIPEGDPVAFEPNVLPALAARRELLEWPAARRFFDIGTPERLKAIEEIFA